MQEANADIANNKRLRNEQDESPDAKRTKLDEAYGDDEFDDEDEFSEDGDSSKNYHDMTAEEVNVENFGVDHKEFSEELRNATNDDDKKLNHQVAMI